MFQDNQSGVSPRVNVEELFDKVISESKDINVNQKCACVVRVGEKYVAKNSPELIKTTGNRYVISDKFFRFYREVEAYDAARVMKGTVTKEYQIEQVW
jgi:hypothetical protein